MAGSVLVVVTNWMSVRIPVELASGLDALRAGTGGVGVAAGHIALLGLLVIVARTASRVLFFTPGRLAEFEIREDLFGHLLKLQPDFYARQTTGDLIARATSDVTYARALAGFALLQTLNVVAAVVLTSAQMFVLSPTLTLLCAVPVAVAFVAIQRGTRRLFELQRSAQSQLAALSDELLGALQGVDTIQSFRVESVFVDRLTRRSAALRSSNLEMTRLRALVFPLMNVASGVCVFVLLGVGGRMVLEGSLSAGTIAGFVALVAYLLSPLRLLGFLIPVFQRAEASLERVFAILDATPTRPDLGIGHAPKREPVGPKITVTRLSLAFPDTDRPVLKDLSVELPAGSTLGVFGRTGAGKSTLLRILARATNPPRGSVFVDDVDILDLDLAAWRRRLVYVHQSPFLFSESIADNIAPGAQAGVAEHAARQAALGPDLAALPQGLDTLVGERGVVLSGGQRQRVALARGLARGGDLVLLDDVLSAVDHQTERELLTSLRSRHGQATTIVVSHRLSVLEEADRILVLDEGMLSDVGTHAELTRRPGPYQQAWLKGEGR